MNGSPIRTPPILSNSNAAGVITCFSCTENNPDAPLILALGRSDGTVEMCIPPQKSTR